MTRRYTSPSGNGPSRATASRCRLSIVYRKGLKQDGSAPLFLYGYGSYGCGHAGQL